MARVFHVGSELRARVRERIIDVVHSNANTTGPVPRSRAALTGRVTSPGSTAPTQSSTISPTRSGTGSRRSTSSRTRDAGRDVLIREDGILPGRITTVPIGIEGDDAGARAGLRSATRRSLGIPDDVLVIGNVARLVPF